MENHFPDNTVGHETTDTGIRVILIAGGVLTVIVAIVGVMMYGTFLYLMSHRATSIRANPMAAGEVRLPPQPRIEEHPALGLQELQKQEDRTLNTYGWADKKSGLVRIPLNRAMELQLQRGFPTRTEPVK